MSDFDFIDSYGDPADVTNDEELPKNEAVSALNVGFIVIYQFQGTAVLLVIKILPSL